MGGRALPTGYARDGDAIAAGRMGGRAPPTGQDERGAAIAPGVKRRERLLPNLAACLRVMDR